MHFKELGTDAMGYGYCDQIDEGFIVSIATRRFFDPKTLTHGFQAARLTKEVHLATDRPFITIHFEPLPRGDGKVTGNVRDQHGQPLQGYYLTYSKGSVSYSVPVANSKGAFQLTGLAPGKYKMRVRAFDYSAYVTATMKFTVPREEAAAIEQDLEVEAK